jgi:putative hydrolase of the HAD superfamily
MRPPYDGAASSATPATSAPAIVPRQIATKNGNVFRNLLRIVSFPTPARIETDSATFKSLLPVKSGDNESPSMPHSSRHDFREIETWVFDLDNTLYPHHLNLWQQVDRRIRDYIVDLLKISHDEAFRLQKDYYRRYGTTLRGLMEEHKLEPDRFLEIVHQIDHSALTPNPELGAAIAALPGRKLILTNGTRHHAEAVMQRLEIDQHFEDIFDIKSAELEPKPRPVVYERFLKRHQVDPKRAVIFEDLARNLEAPHALGMITVLVVPKGAGVVLREEWELAGRDDPHVDYVTDDLADFLRGIAATRSRRPGA